MCVWVNESNVLNVRNVCALKPFGEAYSPCFFHSPLIFFNYSQVGTAHSRNNARQVYLCSELDGFSRVLLKYGIGRLLEMVKTHVAKCVVCLGNCESQRPANIAIKRWNINSRVAIVLLFPIFRRLIVPKMTETVNITRFQTCSWPPWVQKAYRSGSCSLDFASQPGTGSLNDTSKPVRFFPGPSVPCDSTSTWCFKICTNTVP